MWCDVLPFSFSKDNTKSLFNPWKLGLIKWYKYLFCANTLILDSYSFQLIVHLKPNLIVEVILHYFVLIKLQLKHRVLFLLSQILSSCRGSNTIFRHVKIRLTSQLINGISWVLQKLLKYFQGTIISTSFVLPVAGVFPVILI